MEHKLKILNQISDFYIQSNDFNGIPFKNIVGESQLVKGLLLELLHDDLITINFGDVHPNLHINAFNEFPQKDDTEKLDTNLIENACIYPTKKHLIPIIDKMTYHDQPYTYELAIGYPQLILRYFDLTILEMYRNDPRYYYDVTDIGGSIHVREDYYDSEGMTTSDKILLNTFGFGYSKDIKKRVVVVYLRYLSDLSPEHQQIWKSKSLEGDFVPHPDYYRTSMGHFAQGISVFMSFIIELQIINNICDKINRPHLFMNDYSESKRPKEFAFLIRPTLKEFYDFIHITDKLISENINQKFFNGEVDSFSDKLQDKGVVMRERKGTLNMLNEWLSNQDFIKNQEDILKIIDIFKQVRKERQSPAHKITSDEYDDSLFDKQRDLIKNLYQAICVLRHMLAKHPQAKNIDIPQGYLKAKVWVY